MSIDEKIIYFAVIKVCVHLFLPRRLIHLIGNDHFKGWYIYFESAFVVNIFHHIFSKHLSHFGAKVTTAYILKLLTWLKQRLLANNAFAFHFPVFTIAVKYMPMPAMQLNGKAVVIVDGNTISEHELIINGVAVVGLIKCFDAYLYSLGKF